MYINPFDLLNLTSENISDADSAWIKRAKKKLYAEIELSETDSLLYNNVLITKSDCNKAIDDLDDTEKREFHFFIFQNRPLHDFLTKGWLGFFTSFKVESIYKLPAFLYFISPFFSEKYDIILAENYKKSNLENVKVIISVRPIVNENYIELCFKSLYIFLRDIDNQFVVINKDIQDNKSEFAATNFNTLLHVLTAKLNIPILNSLPAYFQGIRNQIASTLRSLSIDIHNEPYEFYEPAYKINEFARSISIDGPVAQNLLKDHVTLKKHYEQYVNEKESEELAKQYSNEFKIYRDFINNVEYIITQIKGGIGPHVASKFTSVPLWIDKNLNIQTLNRLPNIFDDIREKISFQFRQLSVEIWNGFSEIDISIALIKTSLQIKLQDETRTKLEEDYNELINLKQNTKDNEKTEIQDILKAIENVNSQIKQHGMIHIQAPKVKTFLNEIFTEKIIHLLSHSNEIILKRKLFDELEKTLIRLDAFYSNDLLKKIKPIGKNDGELAVRIEKNISGVEFKAKNVLNNVGTGLGKANNKMVTTLPPQLSLIVYLFIFCIVMGLLAAIFGSK
jgi:hypothetical protein